MATGTDRLILCRDYIQAALLHEARHRGVNRDWIERERVAVAVAANQWASSRRIYRRVTVEDVERLEQQAVGHVDYASKLSLYVAEFVLGLTVWGCRRPA